ncbi:MAG TPA: type II CAAX endopeptidase family protein, partial [bacterium]|nr:type II CAAX endopeptidase family protein [bacterium]
MSSREKFPNHWPALAIVFLSILLPFFVASFFIDLTGELILENVRIYLFLGESVIIVPSLLYLWRKHLSLQPVYRLHITESPVVFWAFIFGLSISVLGDELDRLISYIITPPEWLAESMDWFMVNSFQEGLFIFTGIVLVAPIAEELLFRGFLQTTLEYRTQNVTRAVLFTALAFAVLHMNTWWLIQIYLFGIALSYLSWRTQSVIPGILTHMGINTMAILMTNLDTRNLLDWYLMGDHVSVMWLILAGIGFYFGILNIIQRYPMDQRIPDTIRVNDSAEGEAWPDES